MELHQTKKAYAGKETITRVKRQPCGWGRMFHRCVHPTEYIRTQKVKHPKNKSFSLSRGKLSDHTVNK